MYADREETLRGAPGAPGQGASRMDPAERERELQEQLRRRAVESRRRDAPDMPSPRSPSRYDSRTLRRRGDDPYDDGRSRDYGRREDIDYRREPPPPSYRDRRDDYRRDDYRRDDYRRDDYRRGDSRRDGRRRSASPPSTRGSRRNDDYEARSVFCSQLPPQVGERDLGEFFEETLGRDTVVFVQLVYDYHTGNKTNTAFVELASPELLWKANALNGHTMFGKPITVQNAEGARFHASSDLLLIPKEAHGRPHSPGPRGPSHPPSQHAPPSARLYVGNLHYDIGSEQVRAVFEPFGEVDEAEVYYDHATGKSKGFAFVQFKNADDAHRATEQLNGFQLAGRQMRVGTSKNRISGGHGRERGGAPLTTRFDEGGGGGLNTADKRIALMEKLARVDPQSQEPYVSLLTQSPPVFDSPCDKHGSLAEVYV